ncbi:MAG: hypothetical protein KF704_07530 [Crocinitomicaceae bacterium]|nr:hypothetical protein [Crocinitomicaceae bacterium]
MKKMLTMIGLSCWCLLAHGGPSHILCGDDVSVIQDHFQISFGDTITAGISTELPLSVSWSVSPQEGMNKVSGSGKTTGDLIFSQPGTYQVTFNIPAHGDHPAKTETVTVEVGSVKMTFDVRNIEFSKPLTTGDASGIVLTVPVTVKTYEGKTVDYTSNEIRTTGVAHLSSRLKDGQVTLKNGENKLTFELSGAIPQQGNVQFRVYDADGRPTFFNHLITNE